MRRVGDLEGGGLSGNGSGAGCAGAVESGERTAGQRVFHWVSLEYRFFSFFLLSECLCHKYPTLALFVHVKACPWGRVCAIRSQEAVY